MRKREMVGEVLGGVGVLMIVVTLLAAAGVLDDVSSYGIYQALVTRR